MAHKDALYLIGHFRSRESLEPTLNQAFFQKYYNDGL